MRKSKVDTAETRKRIVTTASKLFLARGIAATNIADIMSAAGLTQGGFYRHFESKEQLIAEANHAAFDSLLDMFERATAGKPAAEALDTIVDRYLHQLMKDEPECMCPLANLGSELSRSDEQVRFAAADGHQRLVRLIATKTRLLNIVEYEKAANAIVATMVGAVTLSRLASDQAAIKAILADAQEVIGQTVRAAASA